jgi:hypothetical protein
MSCARQSRTGWGTEEHDRVPDAVQRLFDGAPQSRDPHLLSLCGMGPGFAAHHAAKCGALRSVRGTRLYIVLERSAATLTIGGLAFSPST